MRHKDILFWDNICCREKHEFAHCAAISKRISVQEDIHIREEIAWGTQVLHKIRRVSRPIETRLGSHSENVMI